MTFGEQDRGGVGCDEKNRVFWKKQNRLVLGAPPEKLPRLDGFKKLQGPDPYD